MCFSDTYKMQKYMKSEYELKKNYKKVITPFYLESQLQSLL